MLRYEEFKERLWLALAKRLRVESLDRSGRLRGWKEVSRIPAEFMVENKMVYPLVGL